MTTVAPRGWTITQAPTDMAELPVAYKELIALLVAHKAAAEDRPLPWPTLVEYVEAVASQSSSFQLVGELSERGLTRSLALAIGDLADYGVVSVRTEGVALSARGEELVSKANGSFQSLVEDARRLVDDTLERLTHA